MSESNKPSGLPGFVGSTHQDPASDTTSPVPVQGGKDLEERTESTPGPLSSDHGRTTVADAVVAKIAGVAANSVNGVHKLGSGTARAIGSLKERFPGQRVSVAQGVTVEVGEKQAAVDLDVVVEYGYPIVEIASEIRREVIQAVESLIGLEVTEVNIAIDDVHIVGDDEESSSSSSEARVQ